MSRATHLWAVMAFGLVSSCALNHEAGNYTIAFEWGSVPSEPVWIWMRVEERTNIAESGRILASAGPAEYRVGQPVLLEMPDVSNGEDRVVIVEGREAPNANLRVLYYGISEPFTVEPSVTRRVTVRVRLQPPEADRVVAADPVVLLFEGQERSTVDPESAKAATVRTRSIGAREVVLANDASFSANLDTVRLDDAVGVECHDEPDENDSGLLWLVCDVSGWDLLNGLSYVGDGTYSVFGKFVDDYGYESEVHRASVVLDSTGPIVLNAAVSPPLARAKQPILLSISTDEALGLEPDAAVLNLDPSPTPTVAFSGPVRVGDSNTYVWTADVPVGADGNEYGFRVDLFDRLGNRKNGLLLAGNGGQALRLRVDARAPTLVADGPIVLRKADVAVEVDDALWGIENPGSAEANRLSFDFVLAEENPVAFIGEEGTCTDACPRVLLANQAFGNVERRPELDDAGHDRWGFRYSYAVQSADWGAIERDVPITIVWEDDAGNGMETALPQIARFDFLRPDVSDCSLSPVFAQADSVISYVISTTEPLAEAPSLKATSDAEPLFTSSPDVTAGYHRFAWTQPVAGMNVQEYSVEGTITDRAGNVSLGSVCLRNGHVDGLPPLIETPTVVTEPAVFDLAGLPLLAIGPGDAVRVVFDIVEAQGLGASYPRVYLDAPTPRELSTDGVIGVAEGRWRYEGVFVLDASDVAAHEGLWPVRAVVRDSSGNETTTPALADTLVAIDVTPPRAECALNRDAAKPGDRLLVTVTLSEPVRPQDIRLDSSVPMLVFTSNSSLSNPSGVPPKYVFDAQVPEYAGETGWTYSVQAVDLVGNAAVTQSVCAGSGFVDGVPPAVVEEGELDRSMFGIEDLERPESNLFSFIFRLRDSYPPNVPPGGPCEDSAVCPIVLLGDKQVGVVLRRPDLDDPQGGVTGYAFSGVARSSDWGAIEQDVPVVVAWQDLVGNLLRWEHPQRIRLDFVRPRATDCSLTPPLANAASTIRYALSVSEPLRQAPSLTMQSGNPLLFSGEPQTDAGGRTYEWDTEASNMISESFSVSATIVDLAGNASEDAICPRSATIDGDTPVLTDFYIETAPQVVDEGNAIELAVGPDDVMEVAFTITEAQGLAEGYPRVFLAAPEPLELEILSLEQEAGKDTWTARYTHRMDRDTDAKSEGAWPVRVVVRDLAGNENTVDGILDNQLVHVDFTPPKAECTLVPASTDAGYAISQNAILLVSPYEALATGSRPQLVESFLPDPGAAFQSGFFAFEANSRYRFARVIRDTDGERDFSLAVKLTDLVGNTTPTDETACSTGAVVGAIDGVRPTVSSVDVQEVAASVATDATGPLRAGARVRATFDVDDVTVDDVPTVRIGGGPMDAVDAHAIEGRDAVRWVFERTLTGAEGEGPQPVVVQGTDRAGNAYARTETDDVATFDFTPPLAECFLNNDNAKAGDTVRLTVTFSEPLQGEDPGMLAGIPFVLIAGKSSPTAAKPSFVYEYAVRPEQPTTSWEYSVHAQDRAGNPQPVVELCAGGGVVDGTSIRIVEASVSVGKLRDGSATEWLETGLRASDKSRISVSFALDGNTAAGSLHVRLGEQELKSGGQAGDTLRYSWDVSASGKTGQEQKPLTVSVEDEAGNPTFATLATLTFDYDAPLLSGTPYFVRDPDYLAARIASNDLWVNPGTSVSASFAVNEPLFECPKVFVGDQEVVGGSAIWSDTFLEVSLGDVGLSGDQVVNASLVDLAGNPTFVELGVLRYDRQRPAALEEATQGTVELYRNPWGSSETNGRALIQVRGCPSPEDANPPWEWCDQGAVSFFEPGAKVRVFKTTVAADSERECTPDLLVEGLADASTGAIRLDIPGDWPAVCVSQLDPAGNESEARLVDYVEWIATMGGKVGGSTYENPNTLVARPIFTDALEQADGRELDGASLVAALDGAAERIEGSGSWRRRTMEGPPRTAGAVLVYAPDKGRTFLVGGYNQGSVWAWDGYNWSSLSIRDVEGDASPEPFYIPGVAYDEARGVIVLAEGFGRPTWEMAEDSWKKVADGCTAGPGCFSSRMNPTLAYDRTRREVVEFGGREEYPAAGTLAVLGDTWVWDGRAWEERVPDDPEGDGNPSPRCGHTLVFDPSRDSVLLIGGYADPWMNSPMADTWEWNGRSWRLLVPEDERAGLFPEERTSPFPLGYASASYDERDDLVVLFGGIYEPGIARPYGYTWVLAGERWRLADHYDPGDSSPAYRESAAMAPDPVTGRAILYGGQGEDSINLNDTWAWDGLSWRAAARAPAEGPQDRQGHASTYDSARGKIVIFGGTGPDLVSVVDDGSGVGWEWDGAAWTEMIPSDEAGDGNPAPLEFAAMTYDTLRKRLILYGGKGDCGSVATICAQTWELYNNDWLLRTPADPEGDGNPPALWKGALTYDPVRGKSVLVGGETEGAGTSDRVWEWDGSSWRHVVPIDPENDGNPGGRSGHVLAFDAGVRQTLLLGGGGSPQDACHAWYWNGTSWRNDSKYSTQNYSECPLQDRSAAAVYDPTRRAAALFGGHEWQVDIRGNGLHEYAGGLGWTEVLPADPEGDGGPAARREHTMVFHERRSLAVLFGGMDDSETPETWEWSGGSDSRPGALLRIPLAAADSSPRVRILSARVFCQVGGSSFVDENSRREGVELLGWRSGRWSPMAQNDVSVGHEAPLKWESRNPADIERYLFGSGRSFNLGLRTPGQNSRWRAELSIDYAEARFRYRNRTSIEADCLDGADDDGDGVVDCQDADCNDDPGCQLAGETDCRDGRDDDGDGFADCADPSCLADAACELRAETSCVDGFDNDGDGRADCLDVDCYSHCPEGQECHPGGYCSADWVLASTGSLAYSPTDSTGKNAWLTWTDCARRVRPPSSPAVLKGVRAYLGSAYGSPAPGADIGIFAATTTVMDRDATGQPSLTALSVDAVEAATVSSTGGYVDFMFQQPVVVTDDVLVGFSAQARYPCMSSRYFYGDAISFSSAGLPEEGADWPFFGQRLADSYAPGDLLLRGLFVCFPNCGAKTCGEDGCGGSCGSCDAGLVCSDRGSCDAYHEVTVGAIAASSDGAFGLSSGGTITCARYLKPPGSGASLVAIEVYLLDSADGLFVGQEIKLFHAAQSSSVRGVGSAPLRVANPVSWIRTETVSSVGQYVRYELDEAVPVREGVLAGFSATRTGGAFYPCAGIVDYLAETSYSRSGAISVGNDAAMVAAYAGQGAAPFGFLIRGVFAVTQ